MDVILVIRMNLLYIALLAILPSLVLWYELYNIYGFSLDYIIYSFILYLFVLGMLVGWVVLIKVI